MHTLKLFVVVVLTTYEHAFAAEFLNARPAMKPKITGKTLSTSRLGGLGPIMEDVAMTHATEEANIGDFRGSWESGIESSSEMSVGVIAHIEARDFTVEIEFDDDIPLEPVRNLHDLRVGVVTWNTADTRDFHQDPNFATIVALITAMMKEENNPDLVMVATQENCANKNLEKLVHTTLDHHEKYIQIGNVFGGNGVGWKMGHCDAGVLLYARRSSLVISQLASPDFFTRVGSFKSNRKLNPRKSEEKGLKGLYLSVVAKSGAEVTMCFAGSHFYPGKTISDRLRATQFQKYASYMKDFTSSTSGNLNTVPFSVIRDGSALPTLIPPRRCDTIFYGGDFNFHSSNGWHGSALHDHFTSTSKRMRIVNYMRKVDSLISQFTINPGLDGTVLKDYSHLDVLHREFHLPLTPEFLRQTEEKLTAFMEKKLEARYMQLHDEVKVGPVLRRARIQLLLQHTLASKTGWMEANKLPGMYSQLFPTFQPVPSRKIAHPNTFQTGNVVCGKIRANINELEGVSISCAAKKPQVYIKLPNLNNNDKAAITKARTAATALAALTGGKPMKGLFLQACRPVSFADAILHWTSPDLGISPVRAKTYGPVIGPSDSDHFPMLAVYDVSFNNLRTTSSTIKRVSQMGRDTETAPRKVLGPKI